MLKELSTELKIVGTEDERREDGHRNILRRAGRVLVPRTVVSVGDSVGVTHCSAYRLPIGVRC